MRSQFADELTIAGENARLTGTNRNAPRCTSSWLAAIWLIKVADIARRAAVPVRQAEVGTADPVVLATSLLTAALREVGGAIAARCGQAAAVAAFRWTGAAGNASGVKAAVVGATLPRAIDIAGTVGAKALVAAALAVKWMPIEMLVRFLLGQLQGLAVIQTAITMTDLGGLLSVSSSAATIPILVLLVVLCSLCFGF